MQGRKKSEYKWVKKANMYVRTWFEVPSGYGAKNHPVQKQEWITKEEYWKLP